MDEESTAVNQAEVVDTSTTESAAVANDESTDLFDAMDDELGLESDNSEEEEAIIDDSEESEESEDTADKTESNQTEEPEAGEKEPTAADRRKEQLNTEIRDMVAERNRIAQELEQARQLASQLQATQQQEESQPQTVEGYLEQVNPDTGEYYTPQEAKLALMDRQLERLQVERQQERHVAEVRQKQSQLLSEAQRVVTDFPQFNPESPQYNEALAKRLDRILEGNLIYDPVTNQPVGSHTPIYEIYKTYSDSIQSGSLTGAEQQRKATAKMLKNADVVGGSGDFKADRKSAFEEGFESEF